MLIGSFLGIAAPAQDLQVPRVVGSAAAQGDDVVNREVLCGAAGGAWGAAAEEVGPRPAVRRLVVLRPPIAPGGFERRRMPGAPPAIYRKELAFGFQTEAGYQESSGKCRNNVRISCI